MNVIQLDYTPPGDRCIYCDADAYECEHYEEELQKERDENQFTFGGSSSND